MHSDKYNNEKIHYLMQWYLMLLHLYSHIVVNTLKVGSHAGGVQIRNMYLSIFEAAQ
jgi:hypothetical protein